jgi:flavin reductase (DIM6/NTAB) family NADH-FMN oxidoreductase RutF
VIERTPAIGQVSVQPQLPSVEPEVLREAFRRHPEGVTIVTTMDEFGNQMGITATAVTSVSLDPPIVLFCVSNGSWMIGPLVGGGSFIVHFLAGDQADLARRFAVPAVDKFEGVRYRFSSGGSAHIEGSLAALQCVFHSAFPGGDHTVILGRVIEVHLDAPGSRALAFFGGRLIPVE